jgi:hypothetical protein
MTDITYPNKNPGDQFTAAEANEIKSVVNNKVNKVEGKGLSTYDFTEAEKNKVANLPDDTNQALAGKSALIKAASFSQFPAEGSANNTYLDTTTNQMYHWNGAAYIPFVGTVIYMDLYSHYE